MNIQLKIPVVLALVKGQTLTNELNGVAIVVVETSERLNSETDLPDAQLPLQGAGSIDEMKRHAPHRW